MARAPTYKKIDGKWYRLWAGFKNKGEAKRASDSFNRPNGSFSARAVTLAKRYHTKDRKFGVYRRGRKPGVVYDAGTPSSKNPFPKELKDWLIDQYK